MTDAITLRRTALATVSPGLIAKLISGALGATIVVGLTAEGIQTRSEYKRLLADPIFNGIGIPPGDGHPVMVIPGFLGNDRYLNTLRGWLSRIGYVPVASGLRRNTGFTRKKLEQLEQRALATVHNAGRPISIIGHSLGGIYARAIARRNPDAVRAIVTMGSPLKFDAGPIAPPFTAIYSRADRIVRYPRALAPERGAHNVEAGGCHIGMAFNAEVYRVIGTALVTASAAGAAA
jgi:pimeloyl-ACP methyl ester carboxylesterase